MLALNRYLRQVFKPSKGAFLAGMTLAVPFVAELFPLFPVRPLIMIAVPFLVYMAWFDVNPRNMGSIPCILWMTFIVALLHVYGLWTGPTPYGSSVLRELSIVALIVGVYLLARNRIEFSAHLLRGFFAAVIPFALIAATLGLVKAALLERGILIYLLSAIDPVYYPAGSCLQRDYNLFGLTLLVAGFGLVVRYFQTSRSSREIILYSIAFSLILAAGLFSGSRRFLIFFFAIPILWLAIGASVIPRPQIVRRLLLPIVGVACLIGVIGYIVKASSPVQFYEITRLDGPHLDSVIVKPGAVVIRDINPVLLLNTIERKTAYGFDTRIDRWQLGLDLLFEGGWLNGIGFSYHEAFSSRFTAGVFKDYPHFPILSEWLIGGIVGGMAAVTMYIILLQLVWRAGWKGFASGSSAIALSVVPYSLLSGDTLFSIPQFLIACLLAQSQLAKGNGRGCFEDTQIESVSNQRQ